jgi:2-desacetyl-2-hydroxyethyl bacteriochlorophyllide A dehydrogenase
MRALVYTAPGRVELEERPRPTVLPGEEEISIQVAGVCGSDISGFLGHSALRRPPLVLGHELVGRRQDGRRVVANPLVSCGHCQACISGSQNLCETWKLLGLGTTPGTFAEYVALPTSQIYDIPDSLSVEQAILAEPLSNIVHMFRIASPPPFFRFAIVGAGTMGTLALLAAVRVGAREILAFDVNEQRLATMKTLGATAVVKVGGNDGPEAQRIDGHAFDIVLDASGSAPARQMAFDLCRPGGQVVLLGMGTQRSEVNFVASIRKEHRVVMSFAYTPVDFRRSLDLLIAGEINLTPWTVRMPLECGQEAMERMSHSPGVALKMIMEVGTS